MLPTQTIIDQINTHHKNATNQIKDAVESAIAAGKLLLQVKAATAWNVDNVAKYQYRRL